MKFRRGKKYQRAYLHIGTINQYIACLRIEIESHKRHKQFDEAKAKEELIDKFKKELTDTYDPEMYDLDYYLPQISGLNNTHKLKDML